MFWFIFFLKEDSIINSQLKQHAILFFIFLKLFILSILGNGDKPQCYRGM